jgi:hypothetical protein
MAAGTPTYSADAALVELSAGFVDDVSFLRNGRTLKDRDLLTQGATIIKRYAADPWQLDDYAESGFDLNSAQKTLFISKPEFGNLLANIVNRLTGTDDNSLRASISAVAAETDAKAFIVHAFVRLFLAHEFFHIEQRLGSDQYADSDSYLNVVTAVDYQADLVAIDYVFQNIKTKAEPRLILLLLLAIHIVSMQSFSPSSESLALDRTSFDRLLVWHFQAARIAGAASAPDLHDASFKVMPIISFPRLDAAIRHRVDLKHIRGAEQPAAEAPQDMVVAICGADHADTQAGRDTTQPRARSYRSATERTVCRRKKRIRGIFSNARSASGRGQRSCEATLAGLPASNRHNWIPHDRWRFKRSIADFGNADGR